MEKATIGHNPSWNSRDDSVGSGASGASSEGDNTNTTSTDRLGESSVYANESSQIHRTKVCFGLLATLAGAAVCFIIYFFIVKLDYDRFNLEVSFPDLVVATTNSLFLYLVCCTHGRHC